MSNYMRVNPNTTSEAIDKAWELGHILRAFESDSDESVVSSCIRCGQIAAIDGDTMLGYATVNKCHASGE